MRRAAKFNILSHLSSFLNIENRREDEKALYYPSFRIIPVMLSRTRIYSYSGNIRELMAAVHETSAQAQYAAAHSETCSMNVSGWYRQALKTQDASGSFSSEQVLAAKLKIAPEALEVHLNQSSSARENMLKRKALITAVTVNLLKSDRAAVAVSSMTSAATHLGTLSTATHQVAMQASERSRAAPLRSAASLPKP